MSDLEIFLSIPPLKLFQGCSYLGSMEFHKLALILHHWASLVFLMIALEANVLIQAVLEEMAVSFESRTGHRSIRSDTCYQAYLNLRCPIFECKLPIHCLGLGMN